MRKLTYPDFCEAVKKIASYHIYSQVQIDTPDNLLMIFTNKNFVCLSSTVEKHIMKISNNRSITSAIEKDYTRLLKFADFQDYEFHSLHYNSLVAESLLKTEQGQKQESWNAKRKNHWTYQTRLILPVVPVINLPNLLLSLKDSLLFLD